MKLAKIALSAATFAIDLPYTYRIPPELTERVLPGMRVVVPFGTANRLCEGLVLSVEDVEPPKGRLKSIGALLDDAPVLDREAIRLALWMREQFFCTVWSAALTMLPTGLWYVLRESWAVTPGVDREEADRLAAEIPRGRQVLDLLYAAGGEASLDRIKALEGVRDPKAVLKKLKQAGLVTRTAQAKRKVGDKTEKIAVLAMPPEEALELTRRKRTRSPLHYDVAELLAGLGSVSVKELCYFTGASMSTIKTLQKNGVLTLESREVFRHELPPMGEPEPLSQLNDQQRLAYEGLSALMTAGEPQAALLYGVTGSGKTQVYLHLIRDALDRGKGAIVLVPEIALTPNLLRIFLSHFGKQVAVLHSCLPTGERYDEWKRVKEGLASVVIGTRSAVFAPVRDLGLITCHLGNGGSITAVNHGKSIDTTMGFTPLEGLMMGTRSGNIDPAILTYIMRREGKTFDEMDEILNKESGILGISGTSSDMRDVLDAAARGDEYANLAIDMYVYRVQKAIGGYYAAMTRTDAVVMTAGIGENSADLRERIFAGLAHMGMILDKERNDVTGQIGMNRIISIDDSPIKICVVTTDEEMRIARETDNLVSQLRE